MLTASGRPPQGTNKSAAASGFKWNEFRTTKHEEIQQKGTMRKK
jgi:hypothetical protein